MDALQNLHSYRQFLETIPLDWYRSQLKDVKWVEQDLYPEIVKVVLGSIFKNYWESKNFMDFETWFDQLWEELNKEKILKRFTKYYFNLEDVKENEWFKLGFKARMYRTWISMLTQLDFCYAFDYACEKIGKKVKKEANVELDMKGVDLKVGKIDFQVAKISERKEARPGRQRGNKINIPYPVFNLKEYERKSKSLRVSYENRKKYQNILKAFYKYYLVLNNGFVVFGDNFVEGIVKNLDNLEKLHEFINKVLAGFSGKVDVDIFSP